MLLPLDHALTVLPTLARDVAASLWAGATGTGSSGAGLSLQPSASALPGGDALHQLTDGIGAWALIAALVGLVVGAATWALGSHSNNYQHAVTGRRAVLVSAAAALLIGAAPTLLNFMFATGHGVR